MNTPIIGSNQRSIPVVKVDRSSDEVVNEPTSRRGAAGGASAVSGGAGGAGGSGVGGGGAGSAYGGASASAAGAGAAGAGAAGGAAASAGGANAESASGGKSVTEYKKVTTIKKRLNVPDFEPNPDDDMPQIRQPPLEGPSLVLPVPPPPPPPPAMPFLPAATHYPPNFELRRNIDVSTIEKHTEEPIRKFSAHQDNMRIHQHGGLHQQEQKFLQQHITTEQRYTQQPTEVFEEVETITLQPIGKGVQDLENSKSATLPRSPGATTPMSHSRAGATSPGFFTLPSSGNRGTPFHPLSAHQQNLSSTAHMSTTTTSQHHQTYAPSTTPTSKMAPRAGLWRQNSAYDSHGNTVQDFSGAQTLPTASRSVSHTPVGHRIGQPLHPVPHPNQSRSVSVSSFMDTHAADGTQASLRQVQETSKLWYLPFISREEAIARLKYQPAGSFIVRDSMSFIDAFGLAVKVASLPPRVVPKTNDLQSELVRHYLIEPVGNKGVRLKGFEQEPVFPTLAALIYHHVCSPMALPVRLVLPPMLGPGFSNVAGSADYAGVDQLGLPPLTPVSPASQSHFHQQHIMERHVSPLEGANVRSPMSQTTNQHLITETDGGTLPMGTLGESRAGTRIGLGTPFPTSSYEVLYLGSYDVDFTEGHRAVKVAVDHVLRYIYLNGRHIECHLELSPLEGITLVDTKKYHFMKKNFPPTLIVYCGFDPKNREYATLEENTKAEKSTGTKMSCLNNFFRPIGSKNHRIFAFIVRKPSASPIQSQHDGTCHVLAEVGTSQTAAFIVKDILRTLQQSTASTTNGDHATRSPLL